MDMDTSNSNTLVLLVLLYLMMKLPLFIFLIITIIFIIYPIILHFLHKHLFNLPPTPFPSLPIIGHLYLFLFFHRLPFHRALSNISRRHGPLLFLHLGARPVLLVSSPSAARECFTLNDVAFANRPKYLLNGEHFGYNFTSLAWSPYGPHWRNLRTISALHLLSSHKVTSLSNIRAQEARSMVIKLFKQNSFSNPIDMRKLLFEHTYNMATGMIRGKARGRNSNAEAEAFREIVEEMSRMTLEANAVDFVPIVRWLGFGKHVERKMRSVQEKRDKFMKNVLKEWQRGEEEEIGDEVGGRKHKSLIQILLELKRAEPETYTDETIRNLLLVLIQGASHAAANTLEWAFSRLFQNPHILATARSHIDSSLLQLREDKVKGNHNRLIAKTDLPKLPYLRYIIQETLRMHPPAPLLTPHVSSEICNVGGFRVPDGTMLLVNVWDIQNNPRGVWKEPEKFMPERWRNSSKEEEEEEIQKLKKCENYSSGAFGWGRRGCPGEKLAMQMMGEALGSLIQCFDFEWEKEDVEDMREGKAGVITPRVKPLRAKCIPRPFLVHLLSSSSSY